ncbi:MAG: MDR family oxidoreductase [Pseudomonadota bacterium]
MTKTMKAIVARERDGVVEGRLEEVPLADLPDAPVLVDIAFSTLNYKDGLAVTGQTRIARRLPMICGIDLAGTVAESRDPAFAPGDKVVVNGFGLSETHWGGYAQKQRLRSEWLVRLPAAFSAEQAMAIGTAGYTAMLCVLALKDHGLAPGDGPVLVTGASGGVGSLAVMLLAKLGYEVVAASGRAVENATFLKNLGAARVIERNALARAAKPLEAETWAGVIDSVGGETLATALAQMKYEGVVAACGLAGGAGLATTVIPFILRGVTLRGIDSVMASMDRRQRAWNALAELLDPMRLRAIYRVAPMSEVPRLAQDILAGRVRGRIVIDVNA